MAILTGFPPSNTLFPGTRVAPKVKVSEKDEQQKKYKNYWLDRIGKRNKETNDFIDLSQMTSAGGRYKEYERLLKQDVEWDSVYQDLQATVAPAIANWDFQTALGDTIKEKYKDLYVSIIDITNI